MAATTFRCASATSSDAEAFCALSNSLYARPVDASYYRWQFFETPFPTRLVVAQDDATGGWIGCYGFQLRRLAGRPQPAAWAIDIMISEPHQHRGLFTPLATYAAEQAKDFEPTALCVMANVKADGAHLKRLGWRRAQTFLTHFAAPAPHVCRDRRLEYFSIDDFSQYELGTPASRAGLSASERSAGYLNWRFKQNPRYEYETTGVSRDGEIFGHVVTKRFHDPVSSSVFGDIVDISWRVDDDAALEDMLRFALGRLSEQGVGQAATWLQTNTLLDAIGVRIGFVRSEQSRYFCVRGLEPEVVAMESGDNWFLTMADAEVY